MFSVKLPAKLDKDRILKHINIDKSHINFSEFSDAYDSLYALFPKLVNPQGVFKLVPNHFGKYMHEDLAEVEKLVICMVSIGSGISQLCTNLFNNRDYLKGFLIDAMADELLFASSNHFYKFICEEILRKKGYFLTRRYEPDDHLIPIKFQKNILDIIKEPNNNVMNVAITEGFMYDPIKTMGYVYGADKNIAQAEFDHDCSVCPNIDCKYREKKYE